MLELDIPGFGALDLEHLVLDFNGTLAVDGVLAYEVKELIGELSRHMTLHVLTADTGGRCHSAVAGLPVKVHVLESRPEDEAKLAYVKGLGPKNCACVGNGQNDRLMLKSCVLGVAVLGEECSAASAISAADVVAPGIVQALTLFTKPLRAVATLRT